MTYYSKSPSFSVLMQAAICEQITCAGFDLATDLAQGQEGDVFGGLTEMIKEMKSLIKEDSIPRKRDDKEPDLTERSRVYAIIPKTVKPVLRVDFQFTPVSPHNKIILSTDGTYEFHAYVPPSEQDKVRSIFKEGFGNTGTVWEEPTFASALSALADILGSLAKAYNIPPNKLIVGGTPFALPPGWAKGSDGPPPVILSGGIDVGETRQFQYGQPKKQP